MKKVKQHYLIVFEDGCIQRQTWAGTVDNLRLDLEAHGFRPSAIFAWGRPLYVRKGKQL